MHLSLNILLELRDQKSATLLNSYRTDIPEKDEIFLRIPKLKTTVNCRKLENSKYAISKNILTLANCNAHSHTYSRRTARRGGLALSKTWDYVPYDTSEMINENKNMCKDDRKWI